MGVSPVNPQMGYFRSPITAAPSFEVRGCRSDRITIIARAGSGGITTTLSYFRPQVRGPGAQAGPLGSPLSSVPRWSIIGSVPLPLLQPMLATTGEPGGDQDQWCVEAKWDGWRALVYVDAGLRVRTHTGRQVADSLPELTGLVEALEATGSSWTASWWPAPTGGGLLRPGAPNGPHRAHGQLGRHSGPGHLRRLRPAPPRRPRPHRAPPGGAQAAAR